MRNGRQAEQSWDPPAEYLVEEEARTQAIEAEWQQWEEATMCYVVIDEEVYTLATDSDYVEAKAALGEAGLVSTPVYVGDPDDPDSYANGQILFA